MATPNAIAATGQAVLALIAAGISRDEFPSAKFELYQARNFQTPMEEGISLYLLPSALTYQPALHPLVMGARSPQAAASVGSGDAHS